MNLSKKLVLFLFLQVILFISVLVYFVYNYLYPSYIRFEKTNAYKTMDQVLYTLENEKHHLSTFAMDWSMWDDMVHFVQTKDETFIIDNFSPQAQKTYHIDLIGVFDPKGKMISFHNSFNGTSSLLLNDIITPNNHLLPPLMIIDRHKPYDQQHQTGLCWIDKKLMIITLLPIYPNIPDGEPKGYLLFGRYLDASLLSRMQQQVGTHLEFLPITTITADLKKRLTHMKLHSYIDEYEETNMFTHTLLSDINNRSTIVLSMKSERLIFQKAQESVRQFILMIIGVGIIFVIFSLLFMHFLILKPIKTLQQKIHWIIDNQTFEPIQESIGIADEFTDLADQFNHLIDHVKEQNNALEELSLTDPLTSLQNRRALDQFIAIQCGYLSRHKKSLSVIMIDIDHFKHYNDTYGHLEGDNVIVSVAKIILQNTARSSDFVARYGGEEFVILLPDTSLDGAHAVAQNIREDLTVMSIPHKTSTTASYVTISIGVASTILENKLQAFEIIKNADQALYEAKNNGRNKIVTY